MSFKEEEDLEFRRARLRCTAQAVQQWQPHRRMRQWHLLWLMGPLCLVPMKFLWLTKHASVPRVSIVRVRWLCWSPASSCWVSPMQAVKARGTTLLFSQLFCCNFFFFKSQSCEIRQRLNCRALLAGEDVTLGRGVQPALLCGLLGSAFHIQTLRHHDPPHCSLLWGFSPNVWAWSPPPC